VLLDIIKRGLSRKW